MKLNLICIINCKTSWNSDSAGFSCWHCAQYKFTYK